MNGALNFLKANPALQPLVVIIGGGCCMSAGYLMRLASEPQVKWTDRANADKWAEGLPQDKNTKFLNIQSRDPKTVYKPQAADDVRGRVDQL